MNCKGVIIELSDYLDGELDAAARLELQQHLNKCEDCRVVVDTTRKTVQIFCNSEPVPLPPGVSQRLHAALAERLRKRTT